MSKSGENCTFKAMWAERVGDHIVFHTDMIPEPGPEDEGLSYGDLLHKNGLPVPPAEFAQVFNDPAAAMFEAKMADARGEYQRGDHQRQRPDHPSRYDQIERLSSMTIDNDPAARRRRRRRKIVPCLAATPGIIELHRRYIETGYTMEEFAEYAGVTYKQLWEYFEGRRFPFETTRQRIKSRTGIDVGDPPTRRRPRGPFPRFTDAKRPT